MPASSACRFIRSGPRCMSRRSRSRCSRDRPECRSARSSSPNATTTESCSPARNGRGGNSRKGDDMVAMPSEANWPVTFPGNLRWSNATQIVKGMVAYGAAAMAEIDLITQRLKARAGESELDKVWTEEWSREADRVAKIGDEADAAGNGIT